MMTTMPINAALTTLIEELATEIPDVLTASLTFAAIWADLGRPPGQLTRWYRYDKVACKRAIYKRGVKWGRRRSFVWHPTTGKPPIPRSSVSW